MGYEIHIQREGFDDGADPKGTITTNQWLAAVNAVEGVRISPEKDWVSPEDAGRLLQCFEECVINLLQKEEVVTTGLGKFQLVKRRGMSGTNPRTGDTITIAAKNTLRFTPSQSITDRLQVKT